MAPSGLLFRWRRQWRKSFRKRWNYFESDGRALYILAR